MKRPTTFDDYFAALPVGRADAQASWRRKGNYGSQDVAARSRMIDESGEPVVAPCGDSAERVEEIRRDGVSRAGCGALQPFLVNLYRQEIEALLRGRGVGADRGGVLGSRPGFRVYSERWGFGWKGAVAAEPKI